MIKSYISQADFIASQLHHNGTDGYSTDDLQALGASLERASNLAYAAVLRRRDEECKTSSKASDAPVRGLLDGLRPSNEGEDEA
ncbi:hypothetical protein [Bradyrhizobium sp. B120]|uniref:hypothetical protein n=1 Tax=Bradyrhizobium sp. B120 TaxID=3410088 RepID=UPI003B97EBDD